MLEKKPIRTIVDKDDGKLVGYACGNCGSFFSILGGEEGARKSVERCHNPKPPCTSCGAETSACQRECPACVTARHARWREEEAARERSRFDGAVKVPFESYDGAYLYFPDPQVSNDDFVRTDEVEDEFEEGQMPEYAWACTPFGLQLDVDRILENALEGHHEEAEVSTEARQELKDLLDQWASKQDVVSYEPADYVVILRPPR